MEMNPNSHRSFGRLLLTGAAGGLGRDLRTRLRRHCTTLRVSDVAPLGQANDGEEVVPAPLESASAMVELLHDVDAVIHMGGISTEQPWSDVLPANIIGVYNLYEAARLNGVKRIIFASSNHACGFYKQHEVIGTDAPARPDGIYGLSKAFGEDVARLYFDRFGIETACVRIGSCYPEPTNRRMLSTFLSRDDLERLVVACLSAPNLGCSVIYGISDNLSRWYDNSGASHIGYRPRDSSEPWRAGIEQGQPVTDPSAPSVVYQGGDFVRQGFTKT